jgi:hypothetical protein
VLGLTQHDHHIFEEDRDVRALALAMKMSRKASPSDWASMRQFIMEDECDGLGGLERAVLLATNVPERPHLARM